VVILATTSTTPILWPGDFAAALIISLGADSVHSMNSMRIGRSTADLFVDTMTRSVMGDLRAWLAAAFCTRRESHRPDHGAAQTTRVTDPAPALHQHWLGLFDNLTLGYLLTRWFNGVRALFSCCYVRCVTLQEKRALPIKPWK